MIEHERLHAFEGGDRPSFNVLISSVSQKISCVRDVRRGLAKLMPMGKIIGGDTDPRCLGRYFVDVFWPMPPLTQLSTEELVSYCQKHNILAIIPTRDGELEYYAKRKEALRQQGIVVMGPAREAVRICNDKLLFHKVLFDLCFPVIPTYETLDEVAADHVVVKDRFGAGALNMVLGVDRVQAREQAPMFTTPVFQPFIEGREASIDLFVAASGAVKGVVARTRDHVKNGESVVTTAFRDTTLETLCADMAQALNLRGHSVWQVLIDAKDNYHVIECNCRIGGASSLSVAMGLDSFFWFFLEVGGCDISSLPFFRSEKNLCQVRHASDRIFYDSGL